LDSARAGFVCEKLASASGLVDPETALIFRGASA
jgi:hypothetical protein